VGVLFSDHGGMAGKGFEGYPSDVTDEEWAFVLPYLLLCREDSPQRKHDLRTVFNAVRYVARTGGQWRFLPREFGPWWVVYQQRQRWLKAGCFERLVEDVRSLLREWGGRRGQPTAVCIDSRTLQSTPESGARAGYDGAKRRKGSKVHIAVDTLGHLLALTVTPADRGDREQVAALAEQVQAVTGGTVEMAYVDQGYTGPNAAEAAQQHGLRLEVVKHPMAKRGFVLLPRRWVVERSFAWAARFRRLARDYGRLDTTLKGLHHIAFAILMVRNLAHTLIASAQSRSITATGGSTISRFRSSSTTA
jgi:transposase